VILVDANLLLYAANHASPEHEPARQWLDERLSGTVAVGVPWPSILSFVRLATNPIVMRRPAAPARAWRQVDEWLACEPVWVPLPGNTHRHIVGRFLQATWMTSRLVPDAHLAALAIEHGLTLQSTDGDFAKFPGLKWENPLAA
jgi:toxin-antitoxin system PIN domain toxin